MIRPTNIVTRPPITGTIFRARIAEVPAAGGNAGVQAEQLETYLAEWNATDPTTLGTVGAMLRTLAEGSVGTHASASIYQAMFDHGAAEGIIRMTKAPGGDAITSNQKVRAMIAGNSGTADKWILNLVSAYKKKPLTVKNTEGYFASLGHTGTNANCVTKFINKVGPFFPDEVSDATFRECLDVSTWTDYRLTRVTSGKVIWNEVTMLLDLGIIVLNDEVYNAIQASNDAPWDLGLAGKIPSKIKGFVCVYLETAGTEIDKWYQGNKARDEMPANRIRGAKAIFKRYLELKNNTDGLEAINNVEDLRVGTAAQFF